jgi:hypothetical protein
MDRHIRRTCIQVRRIGRTEVVQTTLKKTKIIKKFVIRSALFSVIPSAVNDVMFHHASLNVDEAFHVTEDTMRVSLLNAILILALQARQ